MAEVCMIKAERVAKILMYGKATIHASRRARNRWAFCPRCKKGSFSRGVVSLRRDYVPLTLADYDAGEAWHDVKGCGLRFVIDKRNIRRHLRP